jgi:hypothetical protein
MKFNADSIKKYERYFTALSETKSLLGQYIRVSYDGDDKFYLTQMSELATVLAQIPIDPNLNPPTQKKEPAFSTLYNTSLFFSLMKTFVGEISITNAGFKYGDNTYKLDEIELEFPETSDIEESLKKYKVSAVIPNLSAFKNLKKFTGTNIRQYDYIYIQNNNYVATDAIVAYLHNNNTDIKVGFPIHKNIASIFSEMKDKNGNELKDIVVYAESTELTAAWFIEHDGLKMIFPARTISIHDFFNPRIKAKYTHTTSLVINKKQLLESVDRMKILTAKNTRNEVAIRIQDNNLISLSSRQLNKSQEFVPIQSIAEGTLDNFENDIFLVNCVNLHNILTCCEGNEIILSVTGGGDAQTIRIDDGDKTFIHVLYPED